MAQLKCRHGGDPEACFACRQELIKTQRHIAVAEKTRPWIITARGEYLARLAYDALRGHPAVQQAVDALPAVERAALIRAAAARITVALNRPVPEQIPPTRVETATGRIRDMQHGPASSCGSCGDLGMPGVDGCPACGRMVARG